MSTQVIALPSDQDFARKHAGAVDMARALPCTNPKEYGECDRMASVVKALMKEIDSEIDPIIESWHQGHKASLAFKKRHREPLEEAEAILKGKMGTWALGEKRKEEAERQRLEAEVRAKAEKARRLDLAEADLFGTSEEKQILESLPVVVESVKVESLIPKGKSSVSVDWNFEITNPAQVPDEYWMIDESKIRKVVKELKDKTNIPGVRVFERPRVAVRT